MGWWKDAQKKQQQLERIRNLSKLSPYSFEQILDATEKIAEVAMRSNRDLFQVASSMGIRCDLLNENAGLREQISILEDGIDEAASELVDEFLNEESLEGGPNGN